MAARVTASWRFPLTHPNDGGPAIVWVPAPDHARQNFKYRWKSITQRSLTEVEPLARAPATRKVTFEIFRARMTDRSYGDGAAIRRCQPTLGE
jgi:hypothetical protein